MAKQVYTEEFKKEAVRHALESQDSVSKVASNLGLKYKTLYNWIQQGMHHPKESIVDYKTGYQQLELENTELRRKLKKVEAERELLKKAAAYFASQKD